jgi:drug/metabolite transporter (DMT)-like permease
MGLGTLAMAWLTVSEGALLVYTTSIWATLFAWLLRGHRPTSRGIGALVLGISGLIVLLGGKSLGLGSEKLPGIVFALAAAVFFALGTVTMRSPLPLPPIALTAWQVGLGCLPMVFLGAILEKPDLDGLTRTGWIGMTYMTAVPMGVCYLSWFAALRRLPTATTSIGTLLTPVVGILAGAFALEEPLGWREIIALVLTLGGVALVVRRD